MVPHRVVGILSGALDQVVGHNAGAVVLDPDESDAALSLLGGFNAWTVLTIGLTIAVLLALTRRTARTGTALLHHGAEPIGWPLMARRRARPLGGPLR